MKEVQQRFDFKGSAAKVELEDKSWCSAEDDKAAQQTTSCNETGAPWSAAEGLLMERQSWRLAARCANAEIKRAFLKIKQKRLLSSLKIQRPKFSHRSRAM
jgi:hypothetical protein